MRNITPARSTTRRGQTYLFMGILAVFGGGIAVVLGVLFVYFPLWEAVWFDLFQILLMIAGAVIAVAGFVIIYRGLTLQKDNPIARAVGEGLSHFLDERYTFLRNVSKRRVGYVDAVLVGPPGALVFRIVDYTGTWINERANWIVQTRNGKLRQAKTNPTRECAQDVYKLRKFLERRGLERVPVYGIVVFTEPGVDLSAEGPVIPISEIPTLYQIMKRDYLADERVAPPAIHDAVNAILDG